MATQNSRPEGTTNPKFKLDERYDTLFKRGLMVLGIGVILGLFALVLMNLNKQQRSLNLVLTEGLTDKAVNASRLFSTVLLNTAAKLESDVLRFQATNFNLTTLVDQIAKARTGQEDRIMEGGADPALTYAFGLYAQLNFHIQQTGMASLTVLDANGRVICRGSDRTWVEDLRYLNLKNDHGSFEKALERVNQGETVTELFTVGKEFQEVEGFNVPQGVEWKGDPPLSLDELLKQRKEKTGLMLMVISPIKNANGEVIGSVVGGRLLNGDTLLFKELDKNLEEKGIVSSLSVEGVVVSANSAWEKQYKVRSWKKLGKTYQAQTIAIPGKKGLKAIRLLKGEKGKAGSFVVISQPIEGNKQSALLVGVSDEQVRLVNERLGKAKRNLQIGLTFILGMALVFNQMITGLRERDFIKRSFSRYVSSSVMEHVLAQPESSNSLIGVSHQVTVLFSDIRDFTHFTEANDPEKVVHILNGYFTRMCDVVHKEGGVVDKFMGDSVMAVWGAPHEHPDDTYRACHAALTMHKALSEFNKSLPEEVRLRMGIGINTGKAIAGNIGSMDRMEYTVIGDDVNLASRAEGLCKPYGVDLVITQFTLDQLGGRADVRYLDTVRVKGKEKPVAIYQLMGLKA